MIKISLIITILLIFLGCDQQNRDIQENIIGHWRNDTEKTDYLFSEDRSLLIVKETGSTECNYKIDLSRQDENILSILFACPQQDWPGYVEVHEFLFTKKYTEFIDTLYIQGIAYRLDGDFYKLVEQ